jgi:uncharacterized protein (TIGR03086 family)
MTTNLITGWPLLDAAHGALRAAVYGVPADGWELPTPCARWNVTQVLQHAALDQYAYAAAIAEGPWPREDPFAPSGHLSQAPGIVLESALEASAGSWAGIGQDAGDTPTPLPQGTMPAALGAGACALDAAVHAWDIAVATGQPSPLTPSMAGPLITVAESLVEPLRAYGAYAPVLQPEPGDDETATLLRYLGRNPAWTA